MCDGLGQNKIVRVGKNSGRVLSRLWTKVYEILGQRRRPFVLSNAFARLSSFSRCLPLRLEIDEKRANVNIFWPPIFFGRNDPTFLRQIVSVMYCPPFSKVWLSSVC